MQAVIMAGGKGTRLVSVTKDEIPKPMVLIQGKPLLEWQISVLKKNGVCEICFVTGHLGEKIREYFGDGNGFGVQISYIEEKEPLGTAGAFYYIKEWLTGPSFYFIFGDVFFDIDLSRMYSFHQAKQAEATLFVHPNSHPFDSDLVKMEENGRISAFDSKHNVRNYWYENCVNAGLYLFNTSVCDRVPTPIKMDLEKQVLSEMVAEGNAVYGYRSPEYVKDIGTVERITSTIQDLKSGFIAARSLKNRQKCIFLDRDGTLNKLKGFLYNIDEFELEDTVIEALRSINRSEWLCIVITNQPVVARGLCTMNEVREIHRKLSSLLGNAGVYIDDIRFCPHHPDKGYPDENPSYKMRCNCRKPNIGMVNACAEQYNIDLSASWMVGDTTTDIQTGINAGMHTALVGTGEGGQDKKYEVTSELTGDTLLDVVKQILYQTKEM